MDTGEAIAIMRSAVLLRKLVNQVITAETRRMQSTHEPGQEHKSPAPVGGVPCEEGKVQEMSTEQATVVIPCPYAWAEHHQHNSKIMEVKTLGDWEGHLAHAHVNIAGTIDSIANKSSSHNPIGISAKYPRQQTKHEQHPKENEQHVPQFIVGNLSFMPMATCQFTATTPRNRNNKEFLALLDTVERLQDPYPDSNTDHNHCCGHCIDDCTARQWVVLLRCGHVHHQECHHAATRNNVFCTCPSCDKNQVSAQAILQARFPTMGGPVIMVLGAKNEAIPDMTTIARTHRCVPILIFLATSPDHHKSSDMQPNSNREHATWGRAAQIPDIWCGCVGSFSTPVGLSRHRYCNIHAFRTSADPGHTRNAL